MPNLYTHCAISKKRTGFDFKELHQWIDESQKELGKNHRKFHHSLNDSELKKIKKHWDREKGEGWGDKAVIEWLFHIAIDNLETAYKYSKLSYGDQTYNYFQFGLLSNGFIDCKFKRKKVYELKQNS
jgi:type I restriction-modification system DNA methylase subunit